MLLILHSVVETLEALPKWLSFSLLAGVGGLGFQFYRSLEEHRRLSILRLLFNGFIAAIIGGTAGAYAAEKFPSFAELAIFILGFASYPILQWAEKNAATVVAKRFGIEKIEKKEEKKERRSEQRGEGTDTLGYSTDDIADVLQAVRAMRKLENRDD